MARGINRITLVGNTGNDVDLKYTQDGKPYARVSLATTFEWKGKDGQKNKKTDWHRLVFRGKLAEIAAEYVRKGQQLYIEGRVSYDKFTGKDGVEKYTTDIFVSEMEMLGSGNGNGNGNEGGQPPSQQRPAPKQSPQQQSPQEPQPQPSQDEAPPMDDFNESDIPF